MGNRADPGKLKSHPGKLVPLWLSRGLGREVWRGQSGIESRWSCRQACPGWEEEHRSGHWARFFPLSPGRMGTMQTLRSDLCQWFHWLTSKGDKRSLALQWSPAAATLCSKSSITVKVLQFNYILKPIYSVELILLKDRYIQYCSLNSVPLILSLPWTST